MSLAAARRSRSVLLALAIGVSGCASLPGRSAPPVAAPVPVVEAPPAPPPAAPAGVERKARASCVPRNLPPPPRYPDTDARLRAAGEAADRYQLLAAGRLLRMRRLAELERIVEACRKAG
ncbi:hypothetical protein [Phenylobacterium sp.]|uniref:hypothetical protein n=1 Tax=Phenylobacterium sp. TaxID=1871053 RepID=UPI002D08E6F1|nr:hypothetical protein [Phenylobacterium sp.]HVI34313.1 hypothetical protein [Phenylobacterium sp.]